MLGVLKWIAKSLHDFVFFVGGVVLFVVISLWWGLGSGDKTEPVPAVIRVPEPVPAVEVSAESVPMCSCGSGVWCEGPRGGRFCMTEAGAKRYKGGP